MAYTKIYLPEMCVTNRVNALYWVGKVLQFRMANSLTSQQPGAVASRGQ